MTTEHITMTKRSSDGAVRQVALSAMADRKKASVSFVGTFSLQNGKSQQDVHSYTYPHILIKNVATIFSLGSISPSHNPSLSHSFPSLLFPPLSFSPLPVLLFLFLPFPFPSYSASISQDPSAKSIGDLRSL